MYKKYSLVVLIILCVHNSFIAQTVLPPNDLDEQYTPKGIGPLSEASANKSSSSSNNYNDDYPKSIVKFTPTLLTRSIFALYYERNFHENFSAQGGIGFNYNKDGFFTTLGSNSFFDNFNSVQGEVPMSEVLSTGKFAGVSPYFYVAPKFIYENYFFDAYSFIELTFFTYTNKVNFVMPIDYNSASRVIVGSPIVKYKYNVFALKYGYQIITDTKLITSHEFFFTVGYRLVSYNPVILTETSTNSYPYTNTQEYSVFSTTSKKPSFMFGIGYSFGIGFNK